MATAKRPKEVSPERLHAADELVNLASTLCARAAGLREPDADQDSVAETLVVLRGLRELMTDGLTWREHIAVFCEAEGQNLRVAGNAAPSDLKFRAARVLKAARAPASVKPQLVEALIRALAQPPQTGGRGRRGTSAVDDAYVNLFRVDSATIRKFVTRTLRKRRA